jgi:hypothetical protein
MDRITKGVPRRSRGVRAGDPGDEEGGFERIVAVIVVVDGQAAGAGGVGVPFSVGDVTSPPARPQQIPDRRRATPRA